MANNSCSCKGIFSSPLWNVYFGKPTTKYCMQVRIHCSTKQVHCVVLTHTLFPMIEVPLAQKPICLSLKATGEVFTFNLSDSSLPRPVALISLKKMILELQPNKACCLLMMTLIFLKCTQYLQREQMFTSRERNCA